MSVLTTHIIHPPTPTHKRKRTGEVLTCARGRELLSQLEHLEGLDLSNNDLCHSAFPSVKRRSNSFSSPLNAISDPFSMWWDADDDDVIIEATTTTTATSTTSHQHQLQHHHHHSHYSADATAAATAAFLASLALTEPVPTPSRHHVDVDTNIPCHEGAGSASVTSASPPVVVGSFSTSPFMPPTPPPSPIASSTTYSSMSTSTSPSTSAHLPPMLPSLKWLNLRNNNLDRIPRYVCFIGSLESLHIELNGLTSLKGVQFLTRLTELDAQMNEIAVRAQLLSTHLMLGWLI